MNNESPVTGQPYKILSIQRAETPPDGVGADWFDYQIGQGKQTIHGCRQGKLRAVTDAVEDIVAQLNERRFGKRGRVQKVPAPKEKKAV